MKIAIFHELHFGGAIKATDEFSKRLFKNHVVDYYYVAKKPRKETKLLASNVFFFEFIPQIWKGNNWKKKIYKDSIELLKLNWIHKKIAAEINNKDYDLVFVHPSQFTQSPFILRYIKKTSIYYCQEPLRIVYDTLFLNNQKDILRKNYEKLNKTVRKRIDADNISKANTILTNSKFTQRNVEKAYLRKSIVSYLGVDSSFFQPEKKLKTIDVLFVGSLDKTDGYFLLEEAQRFLRKKPVVKVINWEKEYVSESELKKYYLSSKMVVCLANNEPFGLIPLEAMSCGIPVIALNEGGYKETVVDNNTGFLIPRNTRILAEKISILLSDFKLQKKFQKNARDHIEKNWDWKKRFRVFENLLSNLIKL